MNSGQTVYILGAGAVGLSLAVYLANLGRRVVVVRTSQTQSPHQLDVVLQSPSEHLNASLETTVLSALDSFDGVVVVTAKTHANAAIAKSVAPKIGTSPVVLLQNGVGVERPFLEAGMALVYRCVLYVTTQILSTTPITLLSTRPIAPCPVGIVGGDVAGLERVVNAINTSWMTFYAEPQIEQAVWKKAIINTIFNSICPLLEVDNGVFQRDAFVAQLARQVLDECLLLTSRLGIPLDAEDIMAQVFRISQSSDGQLISTLQDIRAKRPTEIEHLNLEMARLAAVQKPEVKLPQVLLLGQLVYAKSRLG